MALLYSSSLSKGCSIKSGVELALMGIKKHRVIGLNSKLSAYNSGDGGGFELTLLSHQEGSARVGGGELIPQSWQAGSSGVGGGELIPLSWQGGHPEEEGLCGYHNHGKGGHPE